MAEKLRKNGGFLGKIKAGWSKFLSLFKKDETPKPKKLKKHSKFWALVVIQYREKVDTSWTHSFKTIVQKVVFTIIKFVLIVVAVFLILHFASMLFALQNARILNFFLVFLGFYTILNLISVTLGLVKSLYHAEDNKVLATYPTTSARLFLSKILVFELFELKKSFDILLPISIGFLAIGYKFNVISIPLIIWSVLPLVMIVTITVLLGALLSIPVLFIYNFFKRHPLIEIIGLATIVGGITFLLIWLINMIPENKGDIDINLSYGAIKQAFDNFVIIFGKIVYPVNFAYRTMVGESGAYITNKLTFWTVGRLGIMIGVAGILFGLAFLIIKPFYFVMMTKTFEFDKAPVDGLRKNKKREKHWAILLKETKLTLRDFDISGSYLAVYIAAPILLLLIDKVFRAMATSTTGDLMVIAFNVLLIALPILSSSTIASTIYSREGRTAYFRKTKPILPYFPLTAKVVFNLVFVIPSIAACSYVFVRFTNQDAMSGILLGITILALEYGHVFFSASLDIMNPQNEIYATEGESVSNPNERRSTFIAFITAIAFAGLSFLFFDESIKRFDSFKPAFLKLMIIAIVFAVSCIFLLFVKVKAFYIDRQENSK